MAAFAVLNPYSIPVCILLKVFSIPVIFYLFANSPSKQMMYVYLNMGISRNEYYIIPFAIEFTAFVLLMVICGIVGYAIM